MTIGPGLPRTLPVEVCCPTSWLMELPSTLQSVPICYPLDEGQVVPTQNNEVWNLKYCLES